MKYLLDTHTLLWIFYRKDLINKRVEDILKNDDVYVSAVSFWEISIKFAKGNLDLLGSTPKQIEEFTFGKLNFMPLELNIETAVNFHHLKAIHHRDPFDRMLIWQALSHQLVFITNDSNIHKYQDIGLRVIW